MASPTGLVWTVNKTLERKIVKFALLAFLLFVTFHFGRLAAPRFSSLSGRLDV